MGSKGLPTKTYFAVSFRKDLKGKGCFVSGVNLQDLWIISLTQGKKYPETF